ncbi:DUF2948 family protein [Aureimonas leprariae]|uniref:DUF2948 family protein n=1 Tax=Plantimonas leprariae TaxID=2615207 RepID=A0A7V7PQG6_9HYPH|nr:DUF2948 family protein [Aureimonas leprariae]KAB0680381.1 DUF2948 family protein [Aureimonas leprariae]
MAGLRLDAMDEDDLQILSAYCQDAIAAPADLRFMAREGRFVAALNRFAWETVKTPSRWRFLRKTQAYERRRAILDFGRVRSAQSIGVGQGSTDTPLVLLAVRFAPKDPPGGTIELVFAGNAAIRLDVECVEARLTDEDAVWSTDRLPDHEKPVA